MPPAFHLAPWRVPQTQAEHERRMVEADARIRAAARVMAERLGLTVGPHILPLDADHEAIVAATRTMLAQLPEEHSAWAEAFEEVIAAPLAEGDAAHRAN